MSLAAYKILANKPPFQSVAAHGDSKSAIRDESTVPGEEGLCGDKNVGWISMRTLAASAGAWMAVRNKKLARSGKGVKDYPTHCGSFVKATSMTTALQKKAPGAMNGC